MKFEGAVHAEGAHAFDISRTAGTGDEGRVGGAAAVEQVEPEVVVSEMPPPVARQAFGFGRGGNVPASKLAAMERFSRAGVEPVSRAQRTPRDSISADSPW